MLPGFRFLFAATLLTVSLLVFALGAAALLRASHEQFASLPKQPAPAPVFTQTADAAPPTLSLLRVEPAPEIRPVETVPSPPPLAPLATPQFDTLLPTDRIATLSIAPRPDEPDPAPPVVNDSKPEVTPQIKPEPPHIEATAEPKVEVPSEPLPSEPLPSEPLQSEPSPPAAAAAAPVETVVAAPAPATAPAPVESAAVRIDEPAKVDAAVVAAPDAAPQQVVSLPEPEITGTVTADAPPQPIAPPLVNATPIRRPPVPRARPAAADVMAALPDPAITAPAVNARQPVVRRRRAVVKPVVKPKRQTVSRRPAPRRPAGLAPNPASPFGASPFGT